VDSKAKNWLSRLSRVGVGLWVGGLIAIDFVETPARFRATELDRNQITAMGRRVFAAWGRYEAGLGAVATAASLADPRWRTALVGAMWGAALAQLVFIQPQMQALGEELDFVDRDAADPRYAQLHRLHMAYVGLDVLKLVLAAPALLAEEF
jgi:uncharacterized membrane protein